MRLLHSVRLKNFKVFNDTGQIRLDHPTVLIGPNNCGKTTVLQALALWSQAVQTWQDTKGSTPPKQRTATSLNRLAIASVPVRRTRYFWHNTAVRAGNHAIPMEISVTVLHDGNLEDVTVKFRNHGEDILYCTPDSATLAKPDLIKAASEIDVRLLYPLSGLDSEEPVLQRRRVDVLIGQGHTGQVLRNLCLQVLDSSSVRWARVASLMQRLFGIELQDPGENSRGAIDLFYRQPGVNIPLDIALAGRGVQQMLLLLAFLESHHRSLLLIDEPDAHLEILRQRQAFHMLRDFADQTLSQVVMVSHSEIILDEATDNRLILLLDGQPSDITTLAHGSVQVRNALKDYGTDHYVRAKQRGHVLYLEGTTDLAILRCLADRIDHNSADLLRRNPNIYYVRDVYPDTASEPEFERMEGGFGRKPTEHFRSLRSLLPDIRGLAVFDSNGTRRNDTIQEGLQFVYWRRYELENYIVTPQILQRYVLQTTNPNLFDPTETEVEEVLSALILERIFDSDLNALRAWQRADREITGLLWSRASERVKLSEFAEEFFRRLADLKGTQMLLRKGDLYRLVNVMEPAEIVNEVRERLDQIEGLLSADTA